ncbi:MAG: DUF2281 domain-containing protein [Chroococcidiopsidaceae cyanobacterium CP_BM_ER_R8_30]|nr:DUF2281 domain-containing protein [Chroococcidiopsidaceae cyanobacterium CP_BM_ER_R8_30]
MLEKVHSSDGDEVDEAVIRVLNILSTIADITEPRKYIFDTGTLLVKPIIKRERSLKRRKHNTNLWLWDKVSFYGFFTSLLILMILAAVVSKSYHKIVPPWYLIGLFFSFLFGAMFLSIAFLVVLFLKYMQARQEAGKSNIEITREDAIAYQPIVNLLYTTIRGDKQKLKYAESIIKNLVIEEIQVGEKNTSNFLPLLSPILILLIIWLGFPIQLPQNTSLYNTAITILGLGTAALPILKFWNEWESQSLILKFKRCLFLLEQAQNMADNTSQQVVAATSIKPRPQFGSARGLIKMSDDFDSPLTDFDEYMP